jgi:hypothetical protein
MGDAVLPSLVGFDMENIGINKIHFPGLFFVLELSARRVG